MKKYLLISLSFLFSLSILSAQIQLGQDIDGENPGDLSGSSVSLNEDGSVVAIGAPENDGSGSLSGHVRVYEWDGVAWIQRGQDIDGEAIGDESGSSVSISSDGNTVAIGSPWNEGNGYRAGHVRVYSWDGVNWIQRGLDIDGEATEDKSGVASLSADGNTVAIGALWNDGNGNNSGHVRIYAWDGVNWIQRGLDIDGEAIDDQSGRSVSLSDDGNVVAIGAAWNDGNGLKTGHVRVYTWNGVSWMQRGLDIDGDVIHDNSGWSVSLNGNGNTVAVGAPRNFGYVAIYAWDGVNWAQRGLDIDGEATSDKSAESISLSADGNTLVVGARNNDGNGVNSGHARIYRWDGNSWIQLGQDIDGEGAGDQSGFSVSISADGDIVAVGAVYNDNSLLNAGHVRVFKLKGVYGVLYNDLNQNCASDINEFGISNRKAIIQPGNIIVETTSTGSWYVDSLAAGTYTITIDTSGTWTTNCPITQSFVVTNPDSLTAAPSFGLYSLYPCAEPDVSINMPFMRPCFSNQTVYVQACNTNNGTGALNSAYVIVELDTMISIDNSSLPYIDIGNSMYQVDVGTLNPGQCVNFQFSTTLSCNAQLGQGLCMQADLYPVPDCVLDSIPNPLPPFMSSCDGEWDKSSLSVKSYCQGDTAVFEVTNTGDLGDGDMTCYSPVIVYVDGNFFLLDSVMLLGQETVIFSFPSQGESWHLQVDQHPNHPGNSNPNGTVENCGTATSNSLINNFAHDDADPIRDIYCDVVTGSYDPNDKTGFPLGISNDNLILPGQQLEYRIRFQNTGTDTAFTVVIRDTLSTDFDIFSVQPGVSSHDYEFRIYGPRVLEWTFNNILLPDSTTNEPASNGFCVFKVDQVPGLPNGTELNNSAAIYFDFNAPIITNTSMHTVDDMVNVITSIESFSTSSHDFSLYPNPNDGVFTIDLGDTYQNIQIETFNVMGQQVNSQKYQNLQSTTYSIEQPSGVYFIRITSAEGEYAVFRVVKQ